MMTRKLRGKVVAWDRARGFGELRSGSATVFLHHREFTEKRKTIEPGDRVTFIMGTDSQGRPCAKQVGHIGNGGHLNSDHLLILASLLVLPAIALTRQPIEWLYAGAYFAAINILAFRLYIADKRLARSNGWRIPEAHLHLAALLGGWPAAYLSQRILRHKTSKRSFQVTFWVIVGLYQCVALDAVNGWRTTKRLAGDAMHAVRIFEKHR